jgi:hypothetical protein
VTNPLAWLWKLWTSPSAFTGKARGYALNQLGHGYIIGGIPATIWGPAAILPLVVAYLVVVELPQLALWDGQIADGLEDTAHVATVAVAIAYGIWPALAAHALFVAAGTVARMHIGGSDGRH